MHCIRKLLHEKRRVRDTYTSRKLLLLLHHGYKIIFKNISKMSNAAILGTKILYVLNKKDIVNWCKKKINCLLHETLSSKFSYENFMIYVFERVI